MGKENTTEGWASPRRRWREGHRHEYAWGLFKPFSFLDRAFAVVVVVVVLAVLGVVFTPEIWMPDSILKPELGSHHVE